MKTFFLEDYKGPDCENNSGLRIYMDLSAGTRNNNEKYVLVQVYRRNPEWQIRVEDLHLDFQVLSASH